jgi:hypothetical protein
MAVATVLPEAAHALHAKTTSADIPAEIDGRIISVLLRASKIPCSSA